ncbi:YybH family protein [Streptomyces lydicus]
MNSPLLSEASVRDLVFSWFAALDRRDEIDSLTPFFAPNGLEMQFPEGVVSGLEGLRNWYSEVTGTFFDQKHEIRDITVSAEGRTAAAVDVIVHWYARTWQPPAAKSKSIAAEATQHWVVVAGTDGRPVVKDYRVVSLEPLSSPA